MQKNEKEELNTSLKLMAKSSLIVFVAVVFSKLATYFYRIIIARQFGPETYGLFALSLTIVGWAIVVSRLGLNQGILRYISLYRGENEEKKIPFLFKKTTKILIFTSIIGGSILFLASDIIATSLFKTAELAPFLKIFSFSIPLSILAGSFFALINAYEKIGWHAFFSKILETGTKLFVIILLVFIGVGKIAVPISYTIGGIFVIVGAYIYCRKNIKQVFSANKRLTNRTKKRITSELFSYSLPLIFFGFAISMLHWTDTVIIGLFRSVEDVGFYNAAVPIALLITVSIDLFRHLFFPLVTREYGKNNKEIVKQLSQQVGKWVFMLSFPLLLIMVIFPGVFINFLFGSEFLPAENALRFLAIGALFTTVFEISKELLSVRGKSKLILVDTIIIALLNLFLNILLVPKFGIDGAGAATMISFMSLGLTFAVQSKKHIGIVPLRRKMLGIAIIAIIASSILLFGSKIFAASIVSFLALSSLFAVVYVAGIYLTGCFDDNDKVILKLLRKKMLGR